MSRSHHQFISPKKLPSPSPSLTTPSSAFSIHNNTKNKTYRLLANKAKELYQQGELKSALFYFQEALKNVIEISLEEEVDILYICAAIFMATGEYQKSENYLKRIVENAGNYKNNTFMLLAITLQKAGKKQQCLTVLNGLCQKGIIDALFYRGKIMMKDMKYGQAVKDFKIVQKQSKNNNLQVRMLLIEAQHYLRVKSKNTNVLKILTELLQNSVPQSQNIRKCRNLLADDLLSSHKLQEAEQYIKSNQKQKDSESLLIRSKYYEQKGDTDNHILCLNECISVKDHRRSVIIALHTLVVHSLKQKDFYQAFQYSKRNNHLKIQHKATLNLFKLTQSLTFLMKKKYTQALSLITAIQNQSLKQLEVDAPFIQTLFYSALGYAYFSLGNHSQSLKMYQKIKINQENIDHLAYCYNIKLCSGILAYQQTKIQQSIVLFEQSTDYLVRAEPYFYISVILVQRRLVTNADPQLINKVIEIIDSGLKVGDNYQMYYYRGLLYFYLGMNAEALDDIDKAVDKSQQNVAKFFYVRGLIFQQQKNYQNAISEFNTCLSIDEKYYDAYLQRAKIRVLSQQYQQAFEDLSHYPLAEQWRPLFLLLQGKYSEIIQQKTCEEPVLQTANFMTGNFGDAGSSGKVILAILGQNYQQVISLLKDAIQICFQIGCLDFDDIYLLISYCYFKMGQTEQALQMLNKSEQILKSGQSGAAYGEEDQKKLLAIKTNTIYVHLQCENNLKALQLCNNLINDVYEGAAYNQLLKLKTYISQGKQAKIQIFKEVSMINDYLPWQQLQALAFKYLIPFPKIKVLQIQNVSFDQPLLQFGLDKIDNKAEAPWMRKDQNGVIFTNKIQNFQNLKLYTETQENQSQLHKSSKQRIKDELQLDIDVLNKLERLSKNAKNYTKQDLHQPF